MIWIHWLQALETAKESKVIVCSDDTDVLCLLVHHAAKHPGNPFTWQTNKRMKNEEKDIISYLLFAHAFPRMWHAIHKFGKTTILPSLRSFKIQLHYSRMSKCSTKRSHQKKLETRAYGSLNCSTRQPKAWHKSRNRNTSKWCYATVGLLTLLFCRHPQEHHITMVCEYIIKSKCEIDLRDTDFKPQSFTPIMTDKRGRTWRFVASHSICLQRTLW